MSEALAKSRSRKRIHVGLQDNGMRMSLIDFDTAIAQEGNCYELGKGIIEVSDVPPTSHLAQVQQIRNQLAMHRLENLESIHTVAGSNVVGSGAASERLCPSSVIAAADRQRGDRRNARLANRPAACRLRL